MRRFTVCVDWEEPQSPLSSDIDEIKIVAPDEKAAIAKAKAKWRDTFGRQWPTCRIIGAFVLTKALRDSA